MTHVNSTTADRVSSDVLQMATQVRIDSQAALVAKLKPGTKDHSIATSVLLLLQDSLFVLSQTQMLLRAAREQTEAAKRDGLA